MAAKKTRHASLAEQLAPIAAVMSAPQGPIEPLQTNWTTVAANDNNPEDLTDKRVERRWAVRPTVDEIRRSFESGDVERGEPRKSEDGKIIPGPIVRIGSLRFSDGAQTEKAYTYGPDGKLVQYDARMPVGAMLGVKDRQERMLGGDGIVASNAGYTAAYGAKHPNKVPRRKRQEATKRSKEELQADLAAAIANTDKMPTVTVCKKGFPWKPSSLRELFVGFEKSPKGESGSVAWQDITTHIVEREAWAEIVASLSEEDKVTLATAAKASSMYEIGAAHGKRGRQAWTVGKRRLIAMNDNLMGAIKKYAA